VPNQGLVSNIQRFSVDDGPGIRSTVFLKGCNLHCLWCHNPETIQVGPQIQFFPSKCIACGKCAGACPVGAHLVKDHQRIFTRELCRQCGRCVEVCHTGALLTSGKVMTVDEVMAEVEKDRPFYENSGGGVTFSGGEPLLQIDFVKTLLVQCKKTGLHAVVDTAGNVPWETFAKVLPDVNLFLFDLKVLDEAKHRRLTGAGNHRILNNLKRLAGSGTEVWVRVPVIPGVNDTVAGMTQIAAWIAEVKGIKLTELLPFHRLGVAKYQSLGLPYTYQDCPPPAENLMGQLVEVFREKGLAVKKG
jgi:pyruvate formate lyase activating enzyme